jgi:hypothetical protein
VIAGKEISRAYGAVFAETDGAKYLVRIPRALPRPNAGKCDFIGKFKIFQLPDAFRRRAESGFIRSEMNSLFGREESKNEIRWSCVVELQFEKNC